jgi:hypothetical protein
MDIFHRRRPKTVLFRGIETLDQGLIMVLVNGPTKVVFSLSRYHLKMEVLQALKTLFDFF